MQVIQVGSDSGQNDICFYFSSKSNHYENEGVFFLDATRSNYLVCLLLSGFGVSLLKLTKDSWSKQYQVSIQKRVSGYFRVNVSLSLSVGNSRLQKPLLFIEQNPFVSRATLPLLSSAPPSGRLLSKIKAENSGTLRCYRITPDFLTKIRLQSPLGNELYVVLANGWQLVAQHGNNEVPFE